MAHPIPNRPIKILMLHGYTQSGRLFNAKTGALRKALTKAFPAGVTFAYPDAPIRLRRADVPGWVDRTAAGYEIDGVGGQTAGGDDGQGELEESYGWWVRKGNVEPFVYEGIEKGLEAVAEILRDEGPFDGVLGFSQGGALAGMVASLLEPGRREAFAALRDEGGMGYPHGFVVAPSATATGTGTRTMTTNGKGQEEGGSGLVHPPMKFAVSYSGFGATTHSLYMPFYEPKIKTPMLHFLGTVDTVVEEARSLRLVDACENGRGKNGERIIYHPGGHFLPSSQKQYVNVLAAFIRETVAASEAGTRPDEDRVEDMDMPF